MRDPQGLIYSFEKGFLGQPPEDEHAWFLRVARLLGDKEIA